MSDELHDCNLSRGPYRVEFSGTLVFDGPLHVGTGERLDCSTDAPILRHPISGKPILPGSSIRGVISDWCRRELPVLGASVDAHRRLFGSTQDEVDRQGRLTVLDAEVESVGRDIRDHVRMNSEWGAAAGGGKFDEELAQAKTAPVKFIYEGCKKDDQELILLRCAEKAMEDGVLFFGAKGGSGFGSAKLADGSRWSVIDRGTEENLSAWLVHRIQQNKNSPQESLQFAAPDLYSPQPAATNNEAAGPPPWSWLRLELGLQFDGPMLTAGPFNGVNIHGEEREADARYATDLNGLPILPGSSLRGVISAHGKRILNTLGLSSLGRDLFGFVKPRKDGQGDEEVALRGLLHIGEGQLIAATQGTRIAILNHVAIDRVTGFAAEGKLFSTLALASPRFGTSLTVRWHSNSREQKAALALLLFVLRDMQRGLLWAGSRTTRGYGHLKDVTIKEARLSCIRNGAGTIRREFRDFENQKGTVSLESIVNSLPECDLAWQEFRKETAAL